ncbi:branched-chain amino acid transport system permease protein [Meinhardsimonia xiamenensis]|jgi:branched-chain amino acid transport system permease protein|uniref:Branched-chain amino acid transport system permease protein n=1 Tax=Meinhardsimonia xiamenensis TaxID=990712 RepID=A0A1G9AZ46_9RHOB|nr:branched-chain amino acid ABC transporter permease [Meinhardsimonia xiamenensis]PRX35211.1 branched-chain amino acid transport system permease protein [Meinhardsimonia xiamenensis]SDK31950.1 branched-chain amino acid transport system permease protein [Meinhardsimonia xiamenensis]
MTGQELRALILSTLALAAAAALPALGSSYWLTMGVTIAMYTVLATSWALFSGPTHYISLATAAFFGVGTYTTAIGIELLPYWTLLPIAAALGAVMAALVGFATLRLSGVYFVIFTLGLAEFVRQIITWVQNLTGQKGLYVLTDLTEKHIYWQLLGLAALVYLAGWLIARSRLGFALRIIGDDEEVARHVGIDTALAKIVLFMVPGAVAAVAGAMLAPRYIYIEPSLAFTPMLSFQVVIMALLGGTGRLWGAVVGVIPFTLLWEAISASFPNQTTLLLGVAFLVIVYLLPRGFVGLLEDARRRLGGGGW